MMRELFWCCVAILLGASAVFAQAEQQAADSLEYEVVIRGRQPYSILEDRTSGTLGCRSTHMRGREIVERWTVVPEAMEDYVELIVPNSARFNQGYTGTRGGSRAGYRWIRRDQRGLILELYCEGAGYRIFGVPANELVGVIYGSVDYQVRRSYGYRPTLVLDRGPPGGRRASLGHPRCFPSASTGTGTYTSACSGRAAVTSSPWRMGRGMWRLRPDGFR